MDLLPCCGLCDYLVMTVGKDIPTMSGLQQIHLSGSKPMNLCCITYMYQVHVLALHSG